MKTTNFRGFFLLSILLSVFLLSGCDEIDSVHHIRVTLKNNSSEEMHLWTDGESIDPSNKLAPGASRTNTLKFEVPKTEDANVYLVKIGVQAGRNGATITSKTFSVEKESKALTVVYSGGALSSAQ